MNYFPTMHGELFSWVTAIISAVGTILVNYKNTKGMYVWIISNMMWIYYGLYVQVNHAQVFMFVFFTATNIHGIVKWTRQEKQQKQLTQSSQDSLQMELPL